MSNSEQNRLIAENNNNYCLYRLKKEDQKKICAHYGISQLGTKVVLEKRIVEHRDSIYVYREPTQNEKQLILRKFHFTRIQGKRSSKLNINDVFFID